jgi:plastocyanin
MKLSFLALAAVMLGGCIDATASKDPPAVTITLSASNNVNTCVTVSPDPATIRTGQSIAFRNNTNVSHTIIAEGLNTPWTAVAPGETSGAIEFSIASTRKYYIQSCGNGASNLHTLVITVN